MGNRNHGSGARSWQLMTCCVVLFGAPSLQVVKMTDTKVGTTVFFNKYEGWATGPGPSLLRTADGGITWKKITIGDQQIEAGFDILGIYPVSSTSAWVGVRKRSDQLASGRSLLSTHDSGLTWKAESLPPVEWLFDSLFASDDPNGPLWLGGEVSHRGETHR